MGEPGRGERNRRGVNNRSFSLSALWQDGKLTKEEIVEKYDLFVGSQATDFGEALVRHDEF